MIGLTENSRVGIVGGIMSTALKCPNPSCPYLFDPSTVPAGAVLACPRCGMRFTLSAPTQATSSSPTTGGYGPSTPAARIQSSAASASPPNVTDTRPSNARHSGEAETLPKGPSTTLKNMLLVLVTAVALSGAGLAIWWKLNHKEVPPAPENASRLKELNLLFTPPPSPWVRDEDMKARLGLPYYVVYRRDNPEAYMAFGGLDYDPRSPRPSELRSKLVGALDKLLEPGTRKEYTEDADKTWMDQPIQQGFKFVGGLKNGGSVEGDALAMSHKGIGYWFLSWTPTGMYEEQKSGFQDGRKGCRLLDLRKDWVERQSSTVPFKNNVIGYTIFDTEGIWAEETDDERVKAEDPKADKYLTAKVKQKGRDFHEEAELVVYILDGGADPLAQARSYIETQANRYEELGSGKNTFTEVTGPLEGDPSPNVATGTAPHILLKSVNSRDPSFTWLYAISAITVGDKTVAVCAKTRWNQRAAFDTKFVQLVKSLRSDG